MYHGCDITITPTCFLVGPAGKLTDLIPWLDAVGLMMETFPGLEEPSEDGEEETATPEQPDEANRDAEKAEQQPDAKAEPEAKVVPIEPGGPETTGAADDEEEDLFGLEGHKEDLVGEGDAACDAPSTPDATDEPPSAFAAAAQVEVDDGVKRISYDMTDFVVQAVEHYKTLAGVDKLRKATTPFLPRGLTTS